MESADVIRAEPHDPAKKDDLTQLIHWRLGIGILILFAVGSAISYISYTFPIPDEFLKQLAKQLGVGFIVTAAITGAAQVFLLWNSEKLKDRLDTFVEHQVITSLTRIDETTEGQKRGLEQAITSLGRIECDVEKQTQDLVQAVASLDAMRQSGIVRVYASRASACQDIARDLKDPAVTKIRLIGISLNDFVLGSQTVLNGAWKAIEELVRGERPISGRQTGLDIRVMIIDPDCLGAQLRSGGEGREFASVAGRLKTDVIQTAQHLRVLQNIARAKASSTGVRFEFRLYRVPPIMFLCRTDMVSYVQQYHFWAVREADVPIPVLRYRGLPEASGERSMHKETEIHFDWLWDKASISAEEFQDHKAVGIDRGMYSVGATNVFNDPSEARERLLWHIRHSKKRLYLQGISLKSYFDRGELLAAIKAVVDRDEVDIRILILNPECEQAYFRSFREYLLANPEITFHDFRANPRLHAESELNADTQKTLTQIKKVFGAKHRGMLKVRTYTSAPSCFLLIADDSALVEQYHYGKSLPTGDGGGSPVILGKDTPLIEYADRPSELFESDPLRRPFRLLLDHFNFVFQNCAMEMEPQPEDSGAD